MPLPRSAIPSAFISRHGSTRAEAFARRHRVVGHAPSLPRGGVTAARLSPSRPSSPRASAEEQPMNRTSKRPVRPLYVGQKRVATSTNSTNQHALTRGIA